MYFPVTELQHTDTGIGVGRRGKYSVKNLHPKPPLFNRIWKDYIKVIWKGQ